MNNAKKLVETFGITGSTLWNMSAEQMNRWLNVEFKPQAEQEGRPVVYDYDGYADGDPVYDMAHCPECDYEFEVGKAPWGEPYCPHCGQMLDWRRNEGGES